MAISFDTRYPSVEDLRIKAQKKIPKFAFEYLDGGCNDDHNLKKNQQGFNEPLLPYGFE